GASEGDPRDRRARHLRQRAPRVAARDGGRRRLHQDVHREDQPGLDPARDPVHARDDPRRRGRDGPSGRNEAGGRDPPRQAGDPAPVRAVRDARPRLAHTGALSLRRVLARERRAHADPQAEDRRLPVPGLLHGRLMSEIEHRGPAAPAPLEWEYAPAPEARDIVSLRERYGLYIGGEVVDPRSGEWFTTSSPADESPLAEVAQPSAPSICSGSPASCRSARVSWRWPNRSTAASRSRSRATSTCPWPPRTSSTTPAGPTSSSTPSPTGSRGRWASPARSFPGTSRC